MSVNLPVFFFTVWKRTGAIKPMQIATTWAQALFVPDPDLHVQWYETSLDKGPVKLSGLASRSTLLNMRVTVFKLLLVVALWDDGTWHLITTAGPDQGPCRAALYPVGLFC